MAEIDVNAYATTAANAAATVPSVIETQQPGATGALRQVMTIGDPTTRANLQKVTAAGQGQVTTPDVATTGALAAAAAAVTTAVNSQGIVAIQLTGTWAGTIAFQGTEDPTGAAAASTSWFNVNGVQSVSGAQLASTTTNGQYRVNSGGYTAVRAVMTVFTSGSATVWMNASLAPSMATLAEPLPAGTNNIGGVVLTDISANGSMTAQNLNPLTGVATAGSTVGPLALNGATSVTVQVSGTYTGTPIPQVSQDGVNWVSLAGGKQWLQRDNGNYQDNIVSASGIFTITVGGFANFRLTYTSAPSGTAIVYMRASTGGGSTYVVGNLPSGPNQIGNVGQGGTWNVNTTDGTNVANVLKADGTAAGQNSQLVAGTFKEVIFSTTVAAAVSSTDVSGYKTASVHIVAQGTGSNVAFQCSNDNINWVSIDARTLSASRATGSTGSAGQIFIVSMSSRYFRLNVTGITAGTTSGVIEFSTFAVFPTGLSVGNDSGNMSVNAPTSTGSATPANAFLIGGSNGTNLQPLQVDGSNFLKVNVSASGIQTVSSGSNTGSAVPGNAFLMGTSDGTNLQALRGNESVTLLASAARIATATSADLLNYNGASIIDVILDMTVVGTGSVTITINGKDPASGKYYLLLSGAAVITNSTNVYTLNPQLATAVANVSAQRAIPRIFQIVVTANNVNTATYSVGYNIMRG